MSSNFKKKNTPAGRIKYISAAMLVMTLAVTCVVAITALTPVQYDLHVGSVSPETIYAPSTITDKVTTEALRQSARDAVAPVYKIDNARITQLLNNADIYLSSLGYVRSEALKIRQVTPNAPSGNSEQYWQAVIKGGNVERLCGEVDPPLDSAQLFKLLAISDAQFENFRQLVLSMISKSIKSGVAEKDLSSVRNACVIQLNAEAYPEILMQLGEHAISQYIGVTNIIDVDTTEKLKEIAEADVQAVQIMRGEIIVPKGTQITQAQFSILSELNLITSEGSHTGLHLGIIIYLTAVYAAFAAYLIFYRSEVFLNAKSMVIICVAVIITMLLELLYGAINKEATPALIVVLMTALLVCERTALALNVLIGLSIGLISGGRGTNLIQLESSVMIVASITAGAAAVYSLKMANKRSSIIASGIIGGLSAAVVISGIYLMSGKAAGEIFMDIGWAMGSHLISAVLCVGSMTIWENLFDVATGARLTELSDLSHPLFKQLMTEAPGTYHHSVMTAALAEGAAQAIGCDALLARVGSYYHDVGKLRRPLYFGENQAQGEDIHDTLPPTESAQIIIAHQKDGVTLLNKHKLPSAVVQIAYEHHGNSLVSYFYHKALEGQDKTGGRQVNIKQFRYNGARPSSKESAIVMLADSCEAAVRSLSDPTREDIETMVRKVIDGKINEGQLALAPLTLGNISEIERSFLKTFNGLMHNRIQYPETAQEVEA